MTKEYKRVTFEDITIELSDGLHAAPKFFADGDYIFVNAKNLVNGKIVDIDPEKKTSYEEYLKYKIDLDENTILYSIDGTIGNVAKYRGEKVVLGKGACYLKLKPDVDADYIYFYLNSPQFKNYINSMSTGSTIKHISLRTMRSHSFNLPDIIIQRKVSDILLSLQTRIDTNEKINQNLEEQAKAIFKSWFIDYDPWNGQMPSNWIETSLGKICSCELGGTPSRTNKDYWNGTIPWINSGEVNKFRIIKPSETISELGLSKSATKLMPVKTTVIAITGATLGQVSLLEIDSCANQSVVGVMPNEKLPYEFIYPLIKANIQELISHQTGGAQQHINKQNVESLSFMMPTQDVISAYTNLVNALYARIATNCFENELLTELRDSLLPKLMSAEIDVSEIEI